MLGLKRPPLRGRPSLLDLIAHGAVVETPSRRSSLSSDHLQQLPPLPNSPRPSTSGSSSASNNNNHSSPSLSPRSLTSPHSFSPSPSPSPTMANAPKQSAGDEHHGAIFSVSGPVVVAEDMIGCAMYELVSDHFPRYAITNLLIFCSAMSVTPGWSVKSFESTATRPRFRFTKRPMVLRSATPSSEPESRCPSSSVPG